MILHAELKKNGYDIIIERGSLGHCGEYFDLNRKVLIVTDNGVPAEYANAVAKSCLSPTVVTVKQGEASKSLANFEMLCRNMLEKGFGRGDCVVAVGGGVIGDLAGFAASSYMRGIDFYNIPTTLLSQVDSSIGGKVAVNLGNIKNIVGAFKQPKGVIIDPCVLSSLPGRHIANGLAEALKMSLTSDAELFSLFEDGSATENIDTVIERSLLIKKTVVEQDEYETGLRKILNFGHTIGHGIESAQGLDTLLHGECVALGMLPMCSSKVRERLLPVLKAIGLPTELSFDADAVIRAMSHDKKMCGSDINVIYVSEIGSFELSRIPFEELAEKVREVLGK